MILIIDDDSALAKMMALILGAEGYQARVCHDGATGFAYAEGERPELIVLDLGLPDQDGWSLLDALHSKLGTANIPVLIVSSHLESREKRARREVAAYLPKPFTMVDLVQIVNEILTHQLPYDGDERPARK